MLQWRRLRNSNYSEARGAPWVSKFGLNPLSRKILVLTSAYARRDSGEGEGSPKITRPGEAECPLFSFS